VSRGDGPGPADRLQAFTTLAEERWLTGTGPLPGRPADRLPERAPVLLPRAGIGRWVHVARTARVWVAADGTLIARDAAGTDRVLVPPGRARAGWWLVDRAPVGARLPPVAGGWFVITGADGPLAALRLAEWLPGGPDGPVSPGLVRAAGAEAVCRALGVALESAADPAEAGKMVGAVPPEARFELEQPLARSAPLVGAGCAGLWLTAAILVLTNRGVTGHAVIGLIAGAVSLGALPAADLAAWWHRRRVTRRLPGQLDAWWQARPATRRVPGRGLGLRRGPGGPELVLADGHGGECWLAGPAAGGAAGLAALSADPAQGPWALLLYDRGEQLLAGLRARDWAGGQNAIGTLSAEVAPLGLAVSVVTAPAQPLAASRDRARSAAAAAGGWLRLSATSLSLGLSSSTAVALLVNRVWNVGVPVLAWTLVLIAVRVLAARRAVL
jgi:hypothetical protein